MLGAEAAHAEGSFNTTISRWLTGKESRHWTDKNLDSTATTVKFSGCSTSSTSFRSATLQLKRKRENLPDPVLDRHDNTCNTSNFGRQGSGSYYFNLSRINGSDSGLHLNVNSVTVTY